MKSFYILSFIILLAATSCLKKNLSANPEEPIVPENSHELITTLKMTLIDTTSKTAESFIYKDLDGGGGLPATFGGINQSDSVITILSNHVYKCNLLLLDETKTPIDTISNEVLDEGKDHLFFFNTLNPTGTPYSVYLSGSMTTIKYLDLDINNRGIGLSTLWTAPTIMMSKSQLKIELRHQPDAKDGTYAPGETDVQVLFKLKVN